MINKKKTCCCLLLFSSIWLVPFADADGQRGSDAAARGLKRIIGETAKADVSGGAVSIKQALEEMDVHLAREERETGLPGPSQTTRLTLLAGRTLLAQVYCLPAGCQKEALTDECNGWRNAWPWETKATYPKPSAWWLQAGFPPSAD